MRLQNQCRGDAPSAARTAAKRLLADIRELAPDITSHAAEIEAARRIPPDLVDALRSIGVFRMFMPRSHGGLELDLPAALETIEALGSIDGSVAWTAMIGAGCDIFASLLPRETYEQVYQSGPDVIIAGSAQPAGTAEAAAGGWRVNGRWPFASGCQHADWLFGLCVIIEGGKPVPDEEGRPLVRGFFLPARDWQIEDTWYVAGLKGTGSHHIALSDTVVPPANFFDPASGLPCLPGPLYQAPLQLLPLLHGAVVVGMAGGALNDLVALAETGRQQLRATAPMRESEVFQYELGRVAADLRAARAFHQAQVASHWRHALAKTLKDEALLTQGTQTAMWLATTCVRAADACFALGGGSALYETSPLQRRLRDLHVAAQHAVAQQRHYVSAGRRLLGGSVVASKIAGSNIAGEWPAAARHPFTEPPIEDDIEAPTSPLRAAIVQPGQALPIKPFGLDMEVLLATEATGGAVSVIMACHKPGEGPPDHVHFNQEEMFFIVEGFYEVTVADQTSTVGPGTIVFIPRNVVHRFRNVGDTTARMLDWSLPGGQDHYLKAISELAAGTGFTSERVMEISRTYDTNFPAVRCGTPAE
jgi:alkylation response protein AidB-like acyl-CoA dehydrogenase/mannose-6-phosphate isomerase-like protein (cupin superfamily)